MEFQCIFVLLAYLCSTIPKKDKCSDKKVQNNGTLPTTNSPDWQFGNVTSSHLLDLGNTISYLKVPSKLNDPLDFQITRAV